MDLDILVEKLKKIKEQGFIQTNRAGNTGIGKTLEDLLDIPENNIPLPDIEGVAELKAYRRDAGSMLTLFTLEPLLVMSFGLSFLISRSPVNRRSYEKRISILANNAEEIETVVKQLGRDDIHMRINDAPLFHRRPFLLWYGVQLFLLFSVFLGIYTAICHMISTILNRILKNGDLLEIT